MTVFVAGASGATGRLVVKQLLAKQQTVRIVVRSVDKLPGFMRQQEDGLLTITQASLLDMDQSQFADQVNDCSAVVSCLGHNLTFKGLFGRPRRLVTNAVRRLCEAIESTSPSSSVKFVLMNSAGVSNRDLDEAVSLAQRTVIGLLRMLLPPHADNEAAADFLRTQIGSRHPCIEWCAVRPDSLVDDDQVTPYEAFESPIRSAIFNSGKTSRINVADFMVRLMSEEQLWQNWKSKMPVLYNA